MNIKNGKLEKDDRRDEEMIKPMLTWIKTIEKECQNTANSAGDILVMQEMSDTMKMLIALFLEGKCMPIKMALLLAMEAIMGGPEYLGLLLDTMYKLHTGDYALLSVSNAVQLMGQPAGNA